MARKKPINPDAPPPASDVFAVRTVDPTIPINTGPPEEMRTTDAKQDRDAQYYGSVAVPASQLANTYRVH